MAILNSSTGDAKVGTTQVSKIMLGVAQVWAGAPPVNLSAPVASGGASVGGTIAATNGTWSGAPTGYTYQWQESIASVWTNISGATASTYVTTAAGDFRCVVTATNAYGNASANSNAITSSSGIARIFGSNAVSASSNGHANNRLLASKFVKTNAGAVTTGKVELAGQDGWGLARVRLVALADNAGAPGNVLWYSPEITPADASTEQTFTLPADVSGTDAAGTYWLGIAVYELPGNTRGGPLTGVTTVMVPSFNVATPPSAAGTADVSYDDYGLRVWCDYIG